MNNLILSSVKKINNIADDDTSFDNELILYINTALMIIMQEWHGMDHSFKVVDGTESWDDLLKGDGDYEAVKEDVGLRVKLMFDPPSNSAVLQAIKDQINELEWRMTLWKDLERIDSQ